MQRDDNEWRVVSRRRLTQDRRTPGQCAKCGETNHVTARCKHAEHVQWRRCGKLGHNDKHHYYDQDRGQYVMDTETYDPYMYAGNNARKSKWDLPVIINLNARSLSIEKLDELNVTVGINYVSVLCVTETWFKEYMGNDSLNLHGFNLERKYRNKWKSWRRCMLFKN